MRKEVQDFVALLPALKADLTGWETEAAIGLPDPQIDMGPDKFYGSDEWRQKVKEALDARFGPRATRKRPIATARPIAASSFLIKDTEIIQQWQESAGDLAAVEMELSGVYSAARRMRKEYPILAIRGI